MVAVINSLKGHIYAQKERHNKAEIINGKLISLTFDVGGGAILSSYFNILKKRYNENLILLDTGNIFKSPTSIGLNETTLKVYDFLEFDAIGFTTNEVRSFLNLKRSELELDKMRLPFTNNNIKSIKTHESIKRKGLMPFRIIKLGTAKVGVVSLDFLKNNKDINDFYYQDPIFSFMKLKETLKKNKVNFFILMANLNSNCVSEIPFMIKTFKNKKDHALKCNDKDPLIEFVKRLPPNSVDLIVTSTSSFGSGFLNDIPIIQIPGKGKYLGRAEFTFNIQKETIEREKTTVFPATKLCYKFFLKTEDCYLFSNDVKRFNLVKNSLFQLMPAKYLGYEVQENLELKNLINLTNK